MPPLGLHMTVARELAAAIASSRIEADRGAYYLGATTPDIRVLTHLNLVAITGASGFYRPDRPLAQMKTAIQTWKDRLNKRTISYNARADKLPPSPLDVYKPIAPAAGEPKGASAPAEKAPGAAK